MRLFLQGKKALVTGASHGIGKAIKQVLEDHGVYVVDWSRTTGRNLMSGIDLSDYLMLNQFDIVINNVGGMGTCKFEDKVECMDKNYGITSGLTEFYVKQRGDKGGVVITISSIYGKEKGVNPWFTASKAAQIAYMKTMTTLHKNFRFNTICPGHIDVGKQFPDGPQTIGKPEDVAHLAVFLCSEKAKHINGACITVDGGESHSF